VEGSDLAGLITKDDVSSSEFDKWHGSVAG
jgi:hypothetical protein